MDYGWDFITERIALGGEFQAQQDVTDLRNAGITHVINCREVCDPKYVEDSLVVYWPSPRLPDNGKLRTPEFFKSAGDWWSSMMWDHSKKLYVHCHAGMNRSASMVYYILRLMGIKPKDARHLIVANRPLDMAGAWSDNILGLRYAEEAEKYL